jgi:adenylate cyclase
MDALASDDIFLFENFRLHRRGGGLFRRDEHGVFAPLAIGSRALDVLGALVERPGALVSRDEIIAAVWPATVVEDNNLNMQIAALRRIVDDRRAGISCIQTVPGRGYRFVATVTRGEADLRAKAAALPQNGVRPRLSIVVLPFTNLSNDPEQQYFADGVTEDVTTDLSRIAGSFVISRNTAFTYKDKPVDTKQVGRELGVRYVLEGSVRRSGNQVRVNAQLIDAETDAHLWAERFERGIDDLFALQDEITGRIAVTLSLELVKAEAARPTQHPDAMDYLLRGRAALATPSRESRAAQVTLYERALALDPRSAETQCRLATSLAARVMDNMTDTAAADTARAEVLAEQALATAPHSGLAHQAKGQVLRAQRRFAEAIPEYEMALASNRNWPAILYNLAQCKLFTGSIEETIPLVEQAIRLSPRDPIICLFYEQIGTVHLLQLRIGEAIAWSERARNAAPAHAGIHALLASAYASNHDGERASAELAEARRLSSDDRYSSLARLQAVRPYWGVSSVRALYEATYFIGLRNAGMPEE